MSRHFREILNGNDTTLNIKPCEEVSHISESSYISVGPGGTDVMVRGSGKVLAFDTWEQLVNAIDIKQAAYACEDKF